MVGDGSRPTLAAHADFRVPVHPMSADPLPAAEPFDPALAGTPDRSWEQLLRPTPEWAPGPRPLLVVSPHPDDEVLATGGLMHSQARAGFGVTVLSVTDGAAAYPDWPELGAIRRRELEQALHILGDGRIELVHLALADGQVAGSRAALHAGLSRCLATRPLILAPYEADGHPDHDATGAVSADVARLYDLTLVRYPVWTWHHAAPAAFAATRWGRFPLDPASLRAKAQAIECFASQLRPAARAPIVPPHVLGYFKRAYEAFLL